MAPANKYASRASKIVWALLPWQTAVVAAINQFIIFICVQ